ncbi:protein BUD31 homolog [Clinocottus analis]|uniref:protein BUD31 homolog n=1 Tax=Clinocottus analis TaxID=304258 RepID=UPI0035C0472F
MFICHGDVIQATRRSNGPHVTSDFSDENGFAKSKRKHGELLFSIHIKQSKMPKVKRSRKPPPDGWELIEPTLDELDQKMREAETEPHEGKRKVESLWPIFRLHHQRSRYIYDLFYKRKAISRELYDYCIKEGYADKNLIAKWKKQGYENLCCLRCIQTRDTNFGTNCICRVPKSKLEVGRIIECTHCGCRGCSG